jgi:ATP-dependent Clp protease adaptor protein ClpS
MAVEPKVRTDEETETETERALPWNVVVHNDPITLMSYVTMVLQRLFGYAYPKAHGLMMEVHIQGRSVVWSGAREQAEIHVQRLHSHHLLASLEKVGA